MTSHQAAGYGPAQLITPPTQQHAPPLQQQAPPPQQQAPPPQQSPMATGTPPTLPPTGSPSMTCSSATPGVCNI